MVYIGLIIFFAYFYTAIMINPTDVADNIKKSGAYIPGIRPGKKTAEYIDRILSRITLVGALYIAAVCVLPTLLAVRCGVPFYFGGTALLIVVGVGLDTIAPDRGAPGLAAVRGLRARHADPREARAMRPRNLLLLGRPGRRQGHPGGAPGGAARRAPRSRRATCCAPRSRRELRSGARRRSSWTAGSWCRTPS